MSRFRFNNVDNVNSDSISEAEDSLEENNDNGMVAERAASASVILDEGDSDESEEYTFGDLVGGYRRKWSVGSNMLSAAENIHGFVSNAEDPNFNLSESFTEAVKRGDLREEDIEYFDNVKNEEYFNHQLKNVRQERADNELIDKAGFWENMAAGFIGGVVEDPFTYISLGTSPALKAANLTMKAAMKLAAGHGLKYGVISGAARYGGQTTLSADRAIAEAAASCVISTALGGAGVLVKKSAYDGWIKGLSDYIADSAPYHAVEEAGGFLYSKTVDPIRGVIKEKLSPFISDIINNSPYLRAVTSKDANFRNIMTSLLRGNTIITQETREGATQVLSAESAIDYTHNLWEGVKKKYIDIYKGVKKNIGEEEFNLEVSRYIRGVTRASKNSKEINYEASPEIRQAGDEVLKFWDKMLEEGKKNNVIPRDYIGANKGGVLAKGTVLIKEEADMAAEEFAKKALSGELSDSKVTSFGHFSRIYDTDKIYANKKAFTELLCKSVFKNNPQWTKEEIEKRVGEIMSHVTNTDVGDRFKLMGFDFKGNIGGKFTKPRSVAVTDELLEQFLVNNPLEVGDVLVRRLSTATELNRVAISKGHKDWKSLLESFSLNRNVEGLKLVGNESKAFGKQTAEYQQYLIDTADMLMGTYSKFDSPFMNNISTGIKTWNAMRHLGGVLVSSICDVAGVVSRFGLAGTLKGAVDAFKKQGIAHNQGWERVIHASETSLVSSKMFDETYRQLGNKPFGKWSKRFMKATLLPYWNDYWKKVTATLHYGDILEACINPSKEGGLFLRQHRVSESMREAIVKQYKKYGYEHGGNYILPLDRITDEGISKTLYSAIKTMADETVITVGAGDVPRFLRSGVGSAFLQYRTFSYAYFNNIVMPQLKQSESRGHTAEFLLTTAVLAPFVQAAKYAVRGEWDKIDLNDNHFWLGALKDSGLLGHILDVGEFGVSVLQDPDRAASRISPAMGLGVDLIKAAKIPFQKGKATESQLRKVKGLLPLNNLVYYNWALNMGIRNYSEQTGRRLRK